jgi:hypothetical protein
MSQRTSPASNEPPWSQFGSDLAAAAILLAILGRGGWLAYEQGWLPLGQRSDIAEATVAEAPSADNPVPTPDVEAPDVAPAAPAQQQLPAPEAPTPAPPAPEAPTPVDRKSECPSPSGKVVSGNVALSRRGASVTGPYRDGESLLDGGSDGYGKAKLYCPVVVMLPEVYQLRSVRIHLIAAWLPNNSKESFYQYKLEVSDDGVNYELVADRTSGRHRDWQHITFPPRPVKFIRITGTHDHPHQTGIRIAEIEAYCTNW